MKLEAIERDRVTTEKEYLCPICQKPHWEKVSAERCCQNTCKVCGKPLHRLLDICDSCRKKQAFDRAKKLSIEEWEAQYPGYMVFCPSGEEAYADVDELLSQWAICHQEGDDFPAYCSGSTRTIFELDDQDILCDAIERFEIDLDEVPVIDKHARQDLADLIGKWNAKHRRPFYTENDSVVILIPPELRKEYERE